MERKMSDARERLMDMSKGISTAATVLMMHRKEIDDFLKECRDMENFGSIISPTLYRDPERRAVSAIMKPLCEAARAFLRAYEKHTAEAQSALDKVSGR
jgi:hypothetical protein